MNHRPSRISSLIEHELSYILLREVEFPGALVTVSTVEVTKKLDLARVRVSVLPSDKEGEVQKKLDAAQRELQFKLGRKLNIKPMPYLKFEIDHGIENAAQVEKMLLEVAPQDNDHRA
ncbi:MAG: ribosome-binding factor A [Patescibacteria group bacterium]|nr:ribosome-binding factor A [Patescibacteria group bacterium]